MVVEWGATTLSDLTDPETPVTYGVVKPGDEDPEGVLFIRGGDIADGYVLTNQLRTISKEVSNQYKRTLLRGGEIVMSLVGNPGQVAIVPSTLSGANIARQAALIRLRRNVDSRFVYYFLRSPQGQGALGAHSRGSVQQVINLRDLKTVTVPTPPLAQQRAIAHILGTLDDKIELNRRRNQTLEAMALALFKDWFVDFGPVRAKMEGRARQDGARSGQPRTPQVSDLPWPGAEAGAEAPGEPYLPADLWQLFPDRLDGEGKPEGWRRSTIGSEVTVCGGSTPSTKEPAFWEGGEHHWATPKDLSALKFPVLLDTDRKITDAGIEKISSGLLPIGTVLLSSRAPIGYLAIAEVPTAINQCFIAMKCNGTLPNVFVLFWCRENMDVILGNANGSTFQEISKSNFRPIPVIVPPEPILTAFRERTGPLYRHIVENERESKALAQLRDTLLPKFISGELRIAHAEQLVGTTV